jgi:tetratricopeptide (TPR) repeat protein
VPVIKHAKEIFMDDLLQQGITAYKAGKRDEARKIFITFIKQNPESERGWGWMYDVSSEDKEKIHCLKQMVRINPKNEKAKQLLNQLLDSSLPPIQTSVENNTLNIKDNPMPDLTQIYEPKSAPAQPQYTELDYTAANNKLLAQNNTLLAQIEKHLGSIKGALQFFVVITILAIIVQGCNALLLR